VDVLELRPRVGVCGSDEHGPLGLGDQPLDEAGQRVEHRCDLSGRVGLPIDVTGAQVIEQPAAHLADIVVGCVGTQCPPDRVRIGEQAHWL